MKPVVLPVALLALSSLLIACGGSSSDKGGDGTPRAGELFADPERAGRVLTSRFLKVGEGFDAPGLRLDVPVPVVGRAGGPCAANRDFRFGAGRHDITGPVANTGGAGWEDPVQVFGGLHTRQYARAFVIGAPCGGGRVVFVSADIGLMFGAVRQGVLAGIAADPVLAAAYPPSHVMLSATHTHSGPAGYSHYDAPNLLHLGFDQLVLDTIVDGIVQAIRRAHDNIEAHPQAANILLADGELLNTNINRSKPAFAMNSEDERRQFLNSRGEEVQVNKRFLQLSLVRGNGSAVGVINWFGVHPTTVGQAQTLVSSDNKGYASFLFEKLMKTDHDAPAGSDTFVAAFAQQDEGDASPNIFIEEFPTPDPRRGGGKDDFESNAIAGTKQLAKALSLYRQGKPLTGPVDARLFHVAMDKVTVTDPVVLASLRHPAELDATVKRTCMPALGVSFPGGAEDGPGPTIEGVGCQASPDLIGALKTDLMALTKGKIPPALASGILLCHVGKLPLLDLGCHAEKPVLLPLGAPLSLEPSIVPMQLMRVGNLAILGVPWEVTTMSARRLRAQLLDVLAPAGVDTIVIAGLVNDYTHYLTTREEYASQQYEGASTIFGPWSLAAVQQEARKLAASLRDGQPAPDGPAYVDIAPRLVRLPYIPSDLPLPGGSFGALTRDVPATVAVGETVSADFQAGHPRNDLRIGASHVSVERQQADGSWQAVAHDRDPELVFRWKPAFPAILPLDLPLLGSVSTATAEWRVPCDTRPGTYRLRHDGAAQTLVLPQQAYTGTSSAFEVTAAPAGCLDDYPWSG